MATSAAALYKPWEAEVGTIKELNEITEKLYSQLVGKGGTWVYRGVADASHGFFSSLYRRTWWTKAAQAGKPWELVDPPEEQDLLNEEQRILADAHRWGLHDGERGRLSILRQLAMLQHHHAPTRLVDVSFNFWIALWFATEQQYQHGEPIDDATDGRVFIINVSSRLINENANEREWEDLNLRPWTSVVPDWCTKVRAWRPAQAERRIAAQHGAFLFGGVPTNTAGKRYPRDANSGKTGNWLDTVEVRTYTSLALRFHKVDPATGFKTDAAGNAFTIRIKKELKDELRERLRQTHGFTASTIYPDFPGFGRFGTPQLVEKPTKAPSAP
jgi:hypothetical protein